MLDISQNIPNISDSLYEHIAVLDLAGKIVFINEAWKKFAIANGYVNNTYGLGENYLQISKDTEIEQGIRSVLQGQSPHFTYEYPCHSPDVDRWFLLYVTPLYDNEKKIIGGVTSHINITDRKLAEQQVHILQEKLLQTERFRVLQETAGGAAHEINQPLTAVLGLSGLLCNYPDLPDDVLEMVQDIYTSSQRINKIITEMQKFEQYVSKPYIGKTHIIDFQASGQKET